ncbi:hypothetical protein SKAU_G00019680 [Synaphobranchus kaupii]|uniref:HTH CENPB-type domain-containing protein n=1 Tax=Synaphobranchus kaupii TaxID=118154 RepID=A0A9Q1GCU1_SYNKA|nr:hypothetical protein SKAU_G00019680 [Synaphobranchus kaupii]
MAAFAEATRIIFRIIQTTHHLQNTAVSGGRTTSPASLQKKMQELATLVRPASPTDNTMVKLAGNALNWLHTCLQILEEQYLENLGHLTKKLENIHLSNWPEAFQVATRWAKKKFGRRLQPTTLDIAKKTFTPILTPRSTTSAVSTNNIFSVLADTPPPTKGRTMVAPPQDQYQREWPALRQTYPPGSPAPRRNAERTVLPQKALHHQRNRTSSGITGHHRDWEPMIRRKAKESYATVGVGGAEFAASSGWLDKYLQCNGFSVRRRTTVAQKDAKEFTDKLVKYVAKKITESDIIAMDETSVWFDIV